MHCSRALKGDCRHYRQGTSGSRIVNSNYTDVHHERIFPWANSVVLTDAQPSGTGVNSEVRCCVARSKPRLLPSKHDQPGRVRNS